MSKITFLRTAICTVQVSWSAIGLFLVILALTIACSSSDDADPVQGTNEAGMSASSWASLLASVPNDNDPWQYAVIHDYGRARRLKDLDPKASDIVKKFLTEGENFGTGLPMQSVERTFGGKFGPSYAVLQGYFGKDSLGTTLKARNRSVGTAEYRGVTVYSLDEATTVWAQISPEKVVVARNEVPDEQGGRSRHQAAVMQKLLDANAGRHATLAEFPAYQRLVVGLDSLNAVSAILTTDEFSARQFNELWLTAYGNDAMVDLVERPLLKPLEAFASGWSADSSGTYLAVVLLNLDQESARENAARLTARIETVRSFSRMRWRDYFSEWSIRTDGELVLAKLYTTDHYLYETMLEDLENLWATE